MAIIKNVNSDYVINTPLNVGSNITLSTDTVIIPGNLSVAGTTTSVDTVNTNIKDNIIVLNSGETGNGVAGGAGTAGILIDRGGLTDVQLRWNESTTTWQITTDGSTYGNLLTSATALTEIVQDTTPQLGGNLDVNGYAITSLGYNTVLTGNIQLNNTLVVPGAQANSTVLYASTPAAGQAGLFVVNQASTNEELVTKRRAFGFSLIL